VTDQEADLRAARGGDPAAVERVLAALWPRAFRLAASIAGDRSIAEEAAQDALVLVATRLGTLRDTEAFAVWSARIVVNAARSALRRTRPPSRAVPSVVSASFEDAAAERIDVLTALAALPAWLRVPLILRYAEGLSSAEIGVVLGAPAPTIRFRLALGRRRLAALLAAPTAAAQEEFV
jgi:RNA polymerase sigma-70 factor (ECF subfamily)